MLNYFEDQVLSILGANGEPRRLHIWGPKKPGLIFIAIHGGMSHGADYVNLGQHFKGTGVTTIAMDQRGHVGVDRVHVPDFSAYLDDLDVLLKWVENEYKKVPVVLVGHSMGALILSAHHLEQRYLPEEVRGYVLSSPFFAPVEPISAFKLLSSAAISRVCPSIAVPMEDFRKELTHDNVEMLRISQELSKGKRANEISLKSAYEMIKVQNVIEEGFSAWRMPALFLVAGSECLADPAVTKSIASSADQSLIDYVEYPDNYHENFNESNRLEVFERIEQWLETEIGIEEGPQLSRAPQLKIMF